MENAMMASLAAAAEMQRVSHNALCEQLTRCPTDADKAYMRCSCATARAEFAELKRAIDENRRAPRLTSRQLWLLLRCESPVFPGDVTPLQYMYDACPATNGPAVVLYWLCCTQGDAYFTTYLPNAMLGALRPRHYRVLEEMADAVGLRSGASHVAVRWAIGDGQGHGTKRNPGERCRMVALVHRRLQHTVTYWRRLMMHNNINETKSLFERYCYGDEAVCERCTRELFGTPQCDPYEFCQLMDLVEIRGEDGLVLDRVKHAYDYFADGGWKDRGCDDYAREMCLGTAKVPRVVAEALMRVVGDPAYKNDVRIGAIAAHCNDFDDACVIRALSFGRPEAPGTWKDAAALVDVVRTLGAKRAMRLVCDVGAPVRVFAKTDVPSAGYRCRYLTVLKHPKLLWIALRQGEMSGEVFGRLLRHARDPAEALVRMAAAGKAAEELPHAAARSQAYVQLCIELERLVCEPNEPEVAAALDSLEWCDAAWVLKRAKRRRFGHLQPVAFALKSRYCAPLAVGRCQAASPLSLLDDELLLQIVRLAMKKVGGIQ